MEDKLERLTGNVRQTQEMKDIYLLSSTSFMHVKLQLKLIVGVSVDKLRTVLRDTQKKSNDFGSRKLAISKHGDCLTCKTISKVSF